MKNKIFNLIFCPIDMSCISSAKYKQVTNHMILTNLSKHELFIVIITFLVAFSLPFAVNLALNQTSVRIKATSTPTSLTLASSATSGATINIGDPIDVAIYLNNVNGVAISAIDTVVKYNPAVVGVAPSTPVTYGNIFGSGAQFCGTTCSAALNSVDMSGGSETGKVMISTLAWDSLGGASLSAYSATSSAQIATVRFVAKAATTSSSIFLDFKGTPTADPNVITCSDTDPVVANRCSTTDSNVVKQLSAGETSADADTLTKVTNISFAVTSPTPATFSSVSPTSGQVGTPVTITGTNLGTSGTISFNGVLGTATSWNDTNIVLNVPNNATSGTITIQTVNGTITTTSFSVVAAPPTISNFSPTSGLVGASVTVTGTNFGSTSTGAQVLFNGTVANSITSWNSTTIVATVPNGATTGKISVTLPAGSATSVTDFTVNPPALVDNTPPAITNVAISNVTISGATITWVTDKSSTSLVEYGTTAAYGSSSNGDSGISHSVNLTNLTAGTTYHFRVRSNDGNGHEAIENDNYFTTLTPTPAPTPTPEPTPAPTPAPEPTQNNTPAPTKPTSDLNKDGKVNVFDLSILLRKWNRTSDVADVDLNSDGKVNVFDLSILLRSWNR
ncbi:MAG: IPT/TIG domain-containing protein [Patescibacteria group bacterium]|nr:IPT/TIG domain-containing protein [Patescibacteria group bacterium]